MPLRRLPQPPPLAARRRRADGLPAPPDRDQFVCLAQVGAPHGIRGEVRLKSFTADPLALANYGPLTDESGTKTVEIASLRAAKDVLIARLKGVTDRNAAEKLTNMRLFVPRERLPAIAEAETYYQADLVGLQAADRSDVSLGRVIAVHNFGAGDVLEVTADATGESVFLPFTADAIPVVDLAAGRLVVEQPDQWFASDTQADPGEIPPRPLQRSNRPG